MNCNFVRDNLVAYIHGELDKRAVMQIHQHLSTCEVCVQEEIELRRTNRLLDQYQFEALPDYFDEQLHRKLKQVEKPHEKNHSDFRRIVYAIAATIIIMIGIQFFGSRILQSTRQPAHFKDFPTTQAIFKPVEQRIETKPSLKDRFIENYLQSKRSAATKLRRD